MESPHFFQVVKILKLDQKVKEAEGRSRILSGWQMQFVALLALLWALFQLWYASPLPFIFGFGVFIDVPARGIHLGFALLICFLFYPLQKKSRKKPFTILDLIVAIIGFLCATYLFFDYEGLVNRNGILLNFPINLFGLAIEFPFELILGAVGVLILLEATRRAVGLPLVIVALVFLVYSFFGPDMPGLLAHQGLSLERLIGYQWLGGEAIFGIPISVSTSFVFLFVLFGSMLDQAGGGRYFLNLAVALVGKFKGGPAKAAILASGLTGMISGSSIANVVTTGTFTIPTMKRTGFTSVKAGAIEVAASVNGQIMPPIMGAAAFIIAEMLGITYFQVITHAIIPAAITYIALLFIAHIEAKKLNLSGIPKADVPPLGKTFLSGIHFLIPILVLVFLLIGLRWTAGSAIFYSILSLGLIMLFQHIDRESFQDSKKFFFCLQIGFANLIKGMIKGSRNMVTVAVAIATAGVIVGAVGSTGLSNAMVEIVEVISGGNIIILLVMVMILCLILGLGLPTTANYLVVAALLANVITEIGGASGLVLPLIAVHLFVFYFGLMADVTPPVGLAAYAAAGISRADPIKTGIQAFWYEIRTAILPFVFIFNAELLLVGVKSFWHGLSIFFVSLVAILCFTAATQGWLSTKLKWYEILGLLLVTFTLFRPDSAMNLVSPAFKEFNIEQEQKIILTHSSQVRIHVTRNTDYGPRYKLFLLDVPSGTYKNIESMVDIDFRYTEEGKYVVDEVKYGKKSWGKGIELDDEISKVDIKNANQPSKEWSYLFGFFMLILILFSQRNRSRKKQLL